MAACAAGEVEEGAWAEAFESYAATVLSNNDPVDGDWSFTPRGGVICDGRLWLHDHECRSVMTVAIDDLSASVAVELEYEPVGEHWSEDLGGSPPLLATEGAVWLACSPEAIRRIDSATGHVTTIEVPSVSTWITSNREAVFGYDDSSESVVRLSGRDGSVKRRSVDGYVPAMSASAGELWYVNRAFDTATCIDATTLEVINSVPVASGDATRLIAREKDVIVLRENEIEAHNGAYGTLNVLSINRWGEVRRVGEVPLLSTVTVEGSTLWIGESHYGPDAVDERSDPVGRIRALDLDTGVVQSDELTVVGQVDDLVCTQGRLFISGFVRTKQAVELVAVDVATHHTTVVDLSGVNREYLEHLPVPPGPDRSLDALIAQWPGEIREALTRKNTDIDPGFSLRDVVVGVSPIRIAVTFEWAEEPGVCFGFEFKQGVLELDQGYGEGLDSAADDIWLFVMEEIDCGIMTWGIRREHNGIVWVTPPIPPIPPSHELSIR